MNGFLHDLRYAARTLKRTPAFTTVAIVTLALGIGANTAIFTLIDALFFEPLPVEQADRLVEVHQTLAARPDGAFELSYTDYTHYRDNARAFSGLAAHYPTAPIQVTAVTGERQSEALFGSVVTWNYFPLLAIAPAAGRFFVAEEDRVPGRDPVAVISYDLWQSRFEGNAQVLGERMMINGMVFSVIGVAPPRFHGVTRGVPNTDVWIPSAMFGVGYRYCDAFERSCRVVHLLGRLGPEQTIADAQSEMDVLARQLQAAHPELNKDRGVRVSAARGIRQQERAEYASTAALLLATVGLVLLTACANLSGLLLARGVKRRREIAIRLALGAGRSRLIRQVLTESLVLALLGGAGGLIVAGWTSDLLSAFYGASPGGGRVNFTMQLDGVLLAITLLLSLVTALMIGIIPAWQASRPELLPVLKSEGLPGGATGSRLRDALIVFQVALAVVLVVGAALLMRSVRHVYRGPGFDVERIALLRLRPGLVGYDATRARAFQQEVIRRVEALPGVVSASPAQFPPLPGWGPTSQVWLPGQPTPAPDAGLQANFNQVGTGYFKTLGAPLIAGREFDDRDQQSALPTIIAIRVALGATQGSVARLVVSHGAVLAGVGGALGVAGALAASQALRSLLYGVQPYDPLTLLLVPAFLVAVALAASYLPARRASRVDPLVALRFD